MDSLIFDKIKVKVSFPNQALVDCNATMKKTFLWRSKLLSALVDELWGMCPSRTSAALSCRICNSDIMVSLLLSPHITSP